MKTSMKGILAIIDQEAVVLSTYKDSAGVLTIGVGHTAAAGGMAPRPGDRITLPQAIAMLQADLARYERRVASAVRAPLTQAQFDALVDFDYNTGAIVKGSVDDHINAGKLDLAMAVLQQYDKAGGHKLAGLDRRRDMEERMFVHGIYPDVPAVKVYDKFPGAVRLVPVSSLNLTEAPQVGPAPEAPTITPAGDEPPPAAPAAMNPLQMVMAALASLMALAVGYLMSR